MVNTGCTRTYQRQINNVRSSIRKTTHSHIENKTILFILEDLASVKELKMYKQCNIAFI